MSDATGMNQPWPAGIAMADFDADGDVDLVTGSSLARSGTPWTAREVHLYENVAPVGNWLRVRGAPVGARVEVDAGGLRVAFIDRESLIRSKEAAGRPQDLADIDALRRTMRP